MTEGSQMENGEWKMENEIFIDDCNVCKCEYYYDLECKLYKNESSEPEDTTYDFCKEHPLCEYKATAILERLEQENKEEKKAYNECMHYLACMTEQRNKLKTALEEIKNDLKEVCKEECDYTKPKFCGDCDCRYGQILNRINEVLNGN